MFHRRFIGIKEERVRTLFLVGLGFVIVIELGFTWITNTFMAQTGYDIMSFEFARTTADMNAVLTAWKDIMPMVWVFFALDMIFPVMYALSLSMLALLIYNYSLHKKENGEDNFFILGLTIFVCYLAWIAAFSDYIENFISIYILMFPNSYASSSLSWLNIFVNLKFKAFVLAVIGVFLEILGFLFILLISRFRQEKGSSVKR